jgi:hypothetical protein
MEDVLHRIKEIGNILETKRRKGNLIGHILRRNCLLKHDVEEKIEGRREAKGRRGRRRKQLPDDLKGKREYRKPKVERVCLLVCTNHEIKFTYEGWTAHLFNGPVAVLSRLLGLLLFV